MRLPWIRQPGKDVKANRSDAHSESAPETLSISFDRLKLILVDFITTLDKAGSWTIYAGAALSLWLSLAVSDFPANKTRFGLSGRQWELVFVIVAGWGTIRSLYGLVAYLRRPRLSKLLVTILESAEIAREFRAICVLKVKGKDHDHRVLVYRDPLWDCYLLPHYNMANTTIEEIDDKVLGNQIASTLGVAASSVHTNYISGIDLKSRKHSEFHRQGTLYRFSFYAVRLSGPDSLPELIKSREFVHNGRTFAWLTLSEMEADPNTRHRNLDMTRHLADHANLVFSLPPDSLQSVLF